LRKRNKTSRHHAKRHGLAVNSNIAEELSLFIPRIKWCAAAGHAQRQVQEDGGSTVHEIEYFQIW
jgi:hypothetical protein